MHVYEYLCVYTEWVCVCIYYYLSLKTGRLTAGQALTGGNTCFHSALLTTGNMADTGADASCKPARRE